MFGTHEPEEGPPVLTLIHSFVLWYRNRGPLPRIAPSTLLTMSPPCTTQPGPASRPPAMKDSSIWTQYRITGRLGVLVTYSVLF